MVLGAAVAGLRRHGVRASAVLLAVFPVVHFSFGLGFLHGIAEHLLGLKRRRPHAAAISLSR